MAVVSTKKINAQEVARKFFENRTEQNYNEYYKVYSVVAKKSAANVFKKDVELQDEVVSRVMIKMWLTDSFVYDHSKPHTGYIAVQALNTAKVMFNNKTSIRKRRIDKLEDYMNQMNKSKTIDGAVHLSDDVSRFEVIEVQKSMHIQNFSEFTGSDSEEGEEENIVENIGLKYRELNEEEVDFNCDYEVMLAIIREICKDRAETINVAGSVKLNEEEFIQFVFEALKISAKLYLSDDSIENVSYSQLKEKYGFNSEGAIKSRIHRIREEVIVRQKQINLYKELLSGRRHINGVCRVMKEITIEDILNMADDDFNVKQLLTYTQNTFTLVNGKLHGEFLEYYDNGNVKSRTYYCHGVKHGTCIKYYESGHVGYEYVYMNGIKHGDMVTYDEFGAKITKETYEKGKLTMFSKIDDGNESIEICNKEISF